MGRWLIAIGVLLIAAGIMAMLAERAGIRLGRLPGDIVIRGKHGAFYFPIVTCLIISLLLTLVSWLFGRR
ncbi:MAG TPA: DUF2905 domain-containing protein [Bryobacteraceae bacterium]|nr:DUF2905 domain-containing protein [Bryobacteraceae bacterium]